MFTNSFAPSQREFVVAYFVAFIICTSYQANAILISDALNSFCIRNIVNEFTDCRTISSLCIVGVVYIVGSKCKAELCSVIQPSCTAFASQLCIVVSILVQTYIVASCQESLCSVAFQTDICGVDSRVTINLRSNSRSGLLTSLYKGSRFIRTICLILTKYPFEGVTFVRNRCGGCGCIRRSCNRCRSGCNSFCCGCFSTRCSCSSGCGFASVRNLNNQLAVYISCCDLGVVYATPFKQLTLLVVQLFPFENQREFIVSTVFIAVLQFQTICFCNALNSCFIRNVVVQCEECSTIRNFAAQNLCCAGRRNAPSKALRVFFPLTEVYECIDCIVRLISVAVCIQQCQCCCTFVIGLECNGDTFGIRYIVQVQRNFCIFLTRICENLLTFVDCHCRIIANNQFCGCSRSCGCRRCCSGSSSLCCGCSCLCSCLCGCLCSGSCNSCGSGRIGRRLVGVNTNCINGKFVAVDPPEANLYLTAVLRLNDVRCCTVNIPYQCTGIAVDNLLHIFGLCPVIRINGCRRTKCTLPLTNLVSGSRDVDFNLLNLFASLYAQFFISPAQHFVSCRQFLINNVLIYLLCIAAIALCYCCRSLGGFCCLCCGNSCGGCGLASCSCSCSSGCRCCTNARNAGFQRTGLVSGIQASCCTNQTCIIVQSNFVGNCICNAVIISREICTSRTTNQCTN